MKNIVRLIVSLVIAFSAGWVGSAATTPNIDGWYAGIDKPSLNPPNEVFGPVWTMLYALMGISLFLVWKANYKKSKQVAFTIFGAQLILNAVWSLVFFGLQSPETGIWIIVTLLGCIALTIGAFRPISKPAAYLLVPYLAWVSFATYLNVSIAVLN